MGRNVTIRLSREEQIEQSMKMATYLANKYWRSLGADFRNYYPLEDLIQEAKIGVSEALQTWDPKIAQLNTYSYRRCLFRIQRYVQNNWPGGKGRHEKMRRNKTPKGQIDLPPISMSTLVCSTALDHPMPMLESFFDTRPLPEEVAEQGAVAEAIQKAVEELPERQQAVIKGLFWGERSQASIAQDYGLSQMQISRDRRLALKILKAKLGDIIR